MTRKERYEKILAYFAMQMPEVTTELAYGNEFQLLCAVILSAQCTDKRINAISTDLFRRFPDAKTMSEVEPDEIFEYVKSVSYPNAKAQHLSDMSRMLVKEYGGEVPSDFDALLRLPGVGRKTANVVQAVAFGQATMAVDTHVFRVSHRLGLVSKTDNTPYKVEQQLMKNIPTELIPRAHHWLLLHGRYICTSQRPQCEKCDLSHLCPKLLVGSRLGK